jgi:hypothetical protein
MAKPNLTWAANTGTTDAAWSSAPNAGENFILVDLVNDKITFLDAQQTDGDALSGSRYPVIIPGTSSNEAEKTFLEDASAAIFEQIPMAGTTAGGQSGGNKRYVFAIYFSGATAGVPYLEAWNDNTHAASDNAFLGAGTPANSTLKAIATTNGLPGSETWAGTPLAGASSRVSLDTVALTGAKTLYWNLKQVIPSTFTPQSNSSIVLTCRYLYS